MSERNPARFNTVPNAQQRSAEEQRRLMEEYDNARYESAFNEDDYNETMEAREHEALMQTEERIMESAATKRMYMMAQQIAELRANGGAPEVIADKEQKLGELLDAYANNADATRDAELRAAEMERDTIKGQEIRATKEAEAEAERAKRIEEAEFIINSTDPEWVEEKLTVASRDAESKRLNKSGNPETNNFDDEDDDEKIGGSDPIVNDFDDEKISDDDPVVNKLDNEEKRDGEETYLSKEDALKEAYSEYEKVEGTPYDVDKGRLSKEDALKEAYDEYENVEGAPYDPDKGRLSKEDALKEAYSEYEKVEGTAYDVDKGRVKDVETAHDMAIAEEQDRTLGSIDDVRDEAYAENERRDRKAMSFWKNPGIYMATRFNMGKTSAIEKWRGSRKLTKIAIGVAAIAAAAVAVKIGYDLFNDPNVDASNTPGGNGTNPEVPTPDTTPTPDTPTPDNSTPSPENFSDAAYTVENGEGWYQTFNEMGIPQDEWGSLLDKVGPELAENGWAYKMPNGEWGISQPGQLPKDMLELIQRNR